MTDLIIPDLSEFQTGTDLAALRAGGYPAVILRAHNGWRPDFRFVLWQAQARQLRYTAIGYYQYLVAGRDAAAQARDFAATVGPLRPGEFAICDDEEGAGDQSARVNTWFDALDSIWHDPAGDWEYSGLFFSRAHLGSVRPSVHRWLAAYSTVEPVDVHQLWQFSDAYQFPGVPGPSDASIFHGTVDQLAELVNPPATPPPVPPPPVYIPPLIYQGKTNA